MANLHSDKTALNFRNLHHSYGAVDAVRDFSLTIKAGEVVCLLGPSGCGKTTALRLAAGLEKPVAGAVYIAGKLVADADGCLAPEKRNLGLVFQDYALFPHLTVGRNIAFGLDKLSGPEQEKRIADSLQQVGMVDYAGAYPHMLSGGQQQRVALARAMARKPDLILLDEPFSGLDARLRDQVRDRTLHILKNSGAAALMVTHNAEEAMYMADRIAVMYQGEIVQMGTPSELYNQPVNSFVAEFFGDVNRTICDVVDGQAKTAAGDFPIGAMLAKGSAEVIIRPEAVGLKPASASSVGVGYAKVLAARLLGRVSLVHLCTCNTTGKELHLHARVPGEYLPEEGSIQELEINPKQVFIYPKTANGIISSSGL